jgi:NADH:ubiquinone oxidoreductase subunit C
MSDLEVLWTENNYILLLFNKILNNMYNIFLIKKKNIFFFLNIYIYFFLFSILNSNLIIKVNTIIDIVATHYPDNFKNEFESLYVNLNYKLNLRFFLKILINKENLIVSINEIFKSVIWLEREI